MELVAQIIASISLIYIALISVVPFQINKKSLIYGLAISLVIVFPIKFQVEYLGIVILVIIQVVFLYTHNRNIFTSIFFALIALAVVTISNYILIFLCLKLVHIGVERGGSYSLEEYFFLYLITVIIILILSRMVKLTITRYWNILTAKFDKSFAILMIAIVFLTVSIIYSNIILVERVKVESNIIEYNNMLFIAYFILLLIIVFTMIKVITKEIEYKSKKEQLQNLKDYTNSLEKVYTDMRKFRHDYINILSSIVGYIEDNDMEGLEEHFYKNIMPLGEGIKNNNFRIGLLKNIEIVELKGLLSSKIIGAQGKGIDVFIDISEKINYISMDIIELIRVIGIFLDNAIEAAELCEKPVIKLGVIKKEKSILIIIINSCTKDTPPVYKMFQKGFSTKGKDRGTGLSNVREILNKSSNIFLDTIIKDVEFIQKLEIENEK
ncbi:GHKL domain-containing protein [Clostridium bornimense]|uniref:sensor histidine kinase n=1 Tax=Clostridium bornimense TaxID=1216932 RepID=UPI001C1045DC|nr:GHKL domain-containing protein [Clostridium bornimense]MBU5316332.1 GHKL domain-containing protein [Clostridium bornimense]